MTLRDLNVKEYDEAIQLLDEFKRRVEEGEIMSILVVCEGTSGEMMGGCTTTQNQFTVAGYMITWALRRLGFTSFQDVRMMLSQGE